MSDISFWEHFWEPKCWFSISFYKENVISTNKISIFHWFYKVLRKWSCCGCSGVGRPSTALQPQQDLFRKSCKTNGSSNILRERGERAQPTNLHQPFNAPEPLQSKPVWGISTSVTLTKQTNQKMQNENHQNLKASPHAADPTNIKM